MWNKKFPHDGNEMLEYKNPKLFIDLPLYPNCTISESHELELGGWGYSNKYVISDDEGLKITVMNAWGVLGFMENKWEIMIEKHGRPVDMINQLDVEDVLERLDNYLT